MNIVGCVHTCITTLCIQVEARQKLLEAKDKEEEEDKKAQIDEDAPSNVSVVALVMLLCDRSTPPPSSCLPRESHLPAEVLWTVQSSPR